MSRISLAQWVQALDDAGLTAPLLKWTMPHPGDCRGRTRCVHRQPERRLYQGKQAFSLWAGDANWVIGTPKASPSRGAPRGQTTAGDPQTPVSQDDEVGYRCG